MVSEIIMSEELFHFVKEQLDDNYALQCMLFFADHPYVQFNELAIIHALNQDGRRRYIQKALRALVDNGMIKTSIDSNVLLYSLPETMLSLGLELAKLDVRQRQLFR